MTLRSPKDRQLVAWLSLGQLISWGSVFYLFALVMAPVERELGLSRAQSSLAFSLALLTEGLLAYPIGRWLDRGHERLVMTAGSLVLATGLALHSLVTNAASFYAVWIVLGVGMAATLYTSAFAIVTRRYPIDFRRAIITLTFLGGLASTIFLPLTAWLISQFGWRHAVLALAALHVMVCVPIHFLLLKNAPKQALGVELAPSLAGRDLPDGAAQGELVDDSAVNSGIDKAGKPSGPLNGPGASNKPSTPKIPPPRSLSHHLQSPQFLLLGFFLMLSMAVTAALPTHMVTLLREYGLSEAWAIAIPASIGLVQVLGRLLLYFFEHRFDVHTANRLIPYLLPLALAALLLAPVLGLWHSQLGLALLFAFVLLWGMGVGMLTIVKGTAMAQYVSRQHVASLNGALGLPLALARASAPLVLGLLWNPQSGYTYGLGLLLVLGLGGAVALGWVQRLAGR